MNIDLKLSQLGLKIKNFVLLDLSFPEGKFPEFCKAYENRYIHMPCRLGMALAYAGGISSFGKIVLVYTDSVSDVDLPDPTLNVKLLLHKKDAVWDYFEDELLEFGSSVLLIPEEE